MDYIIAIPSYQRANAIKTHTLRFLENSNIPKEIINIFVANDSEYEEYKRVLGNEYSLIVGSEGLVNQRNFISQYYPINQKIVSMDDDIQDVMIKDNDKLVSVNNLYNLDNILRLGFQTIEKENCNLFGFYPVLNKLFMKESLDYTTGLRFIVGSFYGYINSNIFLTLSEKDDYERTIKYYLRDKKVVRFNGISIKTKYYKMKGGLQSFKDRMEKQLEAVHYLLQTYPTYIKRKKSFKNGFPEVRFVLID